ncbi:MAG: carbon storage regulator CsrA [Clostridia bacterium]|nr:carbon storage regulator CsrA [Clostridia bacterium]
MLILTRKKDESLIINGNIEIQVVALDDGKVKLGISAPKSVEIHRKEIFEKIQEENKSSIIQKKNLDELKKYMKKE